MLKRFKWIRWGIAYLVLVPVFTVFYMQLPANSLHDSNIGLETSVANDAHQLIQALSRSVNDRINSHARWQTGQATMELTTPVRVSEIRKPEHGAILIGLDGEYRAFKRHFIGVGSFDIPVEATLESALNIGRPHQETKVGYPATLKNEPLAPEGPRANPPLSLLLPPPPGALPATSRDSGILLMPERVASRLAAFAFATEGDPYYASGRRGRMLYLSATTITTLGLGDITPVSGTARLLVGLEALLGIIFIGLFLNDLANRARARRRRGTPHPD